jgi:hypothetical protein
MTVTLGKSDYLSDFLFGFLSWIESALSRTLIVDPKHGALCGLEIHVEKALQDMNDKVHWSEIIVH